MVLLISVSKASFKEVFQEPVHSQLPSMFFSANPSRFAATQACCHSDAWHSRLPFVAQPFSAPRKSAVKVSSTSMQNPPDSAPTPTMPLGHDVGAAVGILGW